MPRVPFIGRLHASEYFALLGGFLIITLESFLRIVTLALPNFLFRWLYALSRKTFNRLSSPQNRRLRSRKKSISSPIAKAEDFTELCELYGYHVEEHVIQTTDGYLLGVHRLGYRRGEEDGKVNRGEGSIQKTVVYLHHGLLMNSEVWVCLTEEERCLPFVLVERGYDVWLGNNRGNKYSKKSIKYSPTENAFWNFSIDQFSFHDIPDTIDYVLGFTGQKSLSYVGFSQGTAQAFASLSIHPQLNEKVDVFIALAPAMAPPGLATGIVNSLVKTTPEMLFLLFGRKAILSSAPMWEALLYPAIYHWCVDKGLSFLFNWQTLNITTYQKVAAYPHLFSFTSTKSVVHWFQIIRNGTFQMYDDEVQAPLSISNGARYTKVAKFPTRNIKTPIVLLWGGQDSLVDIDIMMRELPKHTEAVEIPHYEHLDFLWAADVHEQVFPHVLSSLDFFAGPKGSKARRERVSRASPQLPSHLDSERSTHWFSNRQATQPDTEDEDDVDSDTDPRSARHLLASKGGHSQASSPHKRGLLLDAVPESPKPTATLHSSLTNGEDVLGEVVVVGAAHSHPAATPSARKPSRGSIDSGRGSISGNGAGGGLRHAGDKFHAPFAAPGFGIGVVKSSPSQGSVDRPAVAREVAKAEEDGSKVRKKSSGGSSSSKKK